MRSCEHSVEVLCDFGSDGARVLSGHKNGIAAQLQKKDIIVIPFFNHHLALVRGDVNVASSMGPAVNPFPVTTPSFMMMDHSTYLPLDGLTPFPTAVPPYGTSNCGKV